MRWSGRRRLTFGACSVILLRVRDVGRRAVAARRWMSFLWLGPVPALVVLAMVAAADARPTFVSGSSSRAAAIIPSVIRSPDDAGGGIALGISGHANTRLSPAAIEKLGATLARVEWDIGTPAHHLDPVVGAFAAKGIQIQPLAGFRARIPSEAEARNLRSWAVRFGPGGTFWRKVERPELAVEHIEFGNETSYGYQYGDSSRSRSYVERAFAYALRAKDAALGLSGTNVDLLVQADDGGSSNSAWVDAMFTAVPELDELVGGWTIHPYGPTGFEKIDRMLDHLDRRGADNSIPFFITEWGLSSDDGRLLSDNYGYPRDLTYEQAARTLAETVSRWKHDYRGRLAQMIIYQDYEQRSAGRSADREHYFGCLRFDLAAKGAYTAEVRRQLAGGA